MTIDQSQLQQRLDFAVEAARNASELILDYYQVADLSVEHKEDRSPVTEADRNAEQLIRDLIGGDYPEDGILGEELGEKKSQNGFRWILDPVDGTKPFVHGVPLFGTLIGLEYETEVVLGVARFPALNEVVYAARGSGTWWQVGDDAPRQTHVTSVEKLSDALFCFTDIEGYLKIDRLDVVEKLSKATRISRGWGDCYGHILVATGRAEVMVDPLLNVWDAAALLPIVEEAGGHFVDWSGKASIYSGNGISVNAALKDAVLELLKQ
jgi:histidinol-phosphatase